MARFIHYHMDGQYSGPLLANESWEELESVRGKSCAENYEDNRRAQYFLEILPTDKNIADLGSRGVSLDKMEKSNWFIGPEWLQHDDEWPEQPTLARSTEVSNEEKPLREVVACAKEHRPEE